MSYASEKGMVKSGGIPRLLKGGKGASKEIAGATGAIASSVPANDAPGVTAVPASPRIRQRTWVPLRGESQYVSLGHSTARHLRLILVVALVGLVIGVAYARLRAPSYHAEARIVVGTNASLANVEASAGLPAAEDEFASEYARLISSSTVKADVAKRLHERNVSGALTASPIPDSPIIRVDASSASAAESLRLAQVGAQALIATVDEFNRANASTVASLLSLYVRTEKDLDAAQASEAALRARINTTPTDDTATRQSLNAQLATVEAEVASDQLQATALDNQYEAEYSPSQQEEDTVKLSGVAVSTGDNRKAFLEIGVLAGLMGGAVIGLAAAVAVDMRRVLHLDDLGD